MRFTDAWANIVHTNSYLKVLVVSLSLTTLTSIFLTIKAIDEPPIVVRSSCTSEIATDLNPKHTEDEIKTFLIAATKARFNTTEGNLHLLSLEEIKKRTKEQHTLKKNQMEQDILVKKQDIVINNSQASILSDRLISVKDVRSAFLFRLIVDFSKAPRSSLNPYGLVLTKIKVAPHKNKGNQ